MIRKRSPGDIALIVIGSIAGLLIIIYSSRKWKERNIRIRKGDESPVSMVPRLLPGELYL